MVGNEQRDTTAKPDEGKPTDAERQAVWREMVEADGRVARLEREMKELRRRLEDAAKRAGNAVR